MICKDVDRIHFGSRIGIYKFVSRVKIVYNTVLKIMSLVLGVDRNNCHVHLVSASLEVQPSVFRLRLTKKKPQT